MSALSDRLVYDEADVLALLDALLAGRGNDWWDGFYTDRARPCPFFTPLPDESLAGWVQEQRIRPGRALDLGCGNGRNAIFLAQLGFTVEGVDYAHQAIDWASERARCAGQAVQWHCSSVFDFRYEAGAYDLVYDSGCFHHLPPHRRRSYVERVSAALKPGGWFGLTCFRPEGGSGLSDHAVYAQRTLGGGLGYTQEQLRAIWGRELGVCEIRQMREAAADSGHFGKDCLWALLARKPG